MASPSLILSERRPSQKILGNSFFHWNAPNDEPLIVVLSYADLATQPIPARIIKAVQRNPEGCSR